MTRAGGAAALAVLLAAAGCMRRPPAVAPSPHYVVGAGYQAAGVWFYPREDFHYRATGLAAVLGERSGLTADGEAQDGSALTAAHQTLQLPAIARVTNLQTGRQILVRVNDRGPETPKRLIGLSRRAAELLGIAPGGTAPVRVEVEEAASAALRDRWGGGPKLPLAAAPRGTVTAEALAPPPGVGQSTRGRTGPGATAATTGQAPEAAAVPDRLPEAVLQTPPAPVVLRIDAGTFAQAGYARQVAARLGAIGGRVEQERDGRSSRYRVVAGPFADVAAADAALDQAGRAGVGDARIVAE